MDVFIVGLLGLLSQPPVVNFEPNAVGFDQVISLYNS
jgi:hypothetical protein